MPRQSDCARVHLDVWWWSRQRPALRGPEHPETRLTMALLTHARTQAVAFDTLPANLQRLVDDTLWTLGIEDGHTANGGGVPDASTRLATSAATAAAVGLHLPAGDELTQCANCRAIGPTRDIR